MDNSPYIYLMGEDSFLIVLLVLFRKYVGVLELQRK